MSTVTTRARPGLALVVLATTQLMFVLDGAVVNIALPSMQSALAFADGDLAWVVNGYVLAFGGLLLLGGRAADLYGGRRVFLLGVGAFTLASLAGGFATSGELLVATRVLQGAGAAVASPAALALVSTTFEAGPARTKALAVFSAAAGAGTAVGLIAGGLLTDVFSWRGVMFVNVPIGVAVLVATPRVLAESPRQRDPIDVLGAVLGSAGLAAAVYAIARAGDPRQELGDPVTLTCAGLAIAALVAFGWRQARVPYPILPLRLFRDRDRTCAYVVVLLVGGSLSLTYFLSLHVQHVLGYGPLRAGLAFLPFAVGIAFGSWLAARAAGRLPARAVTGIGLLLAVVGALFYRHFTADSSYAGDLLGPMLVWSTGMGMTFVPMTATVLAKVPSREAGIASAVIGTVQQIGGAVGLAVLAAISTAAQDERLPAAARELARARTEGDRDTVVRALDAMVHGYGAAYTASLLLLVIAGFVVLFGVTAPARDRVPRS